MVLMNLSCLGLSDHLLSFHRRPVAAEKGLYDSSGVYDWAVHNRRPGCLFEEVSRICIKTLNEVVGSQRGTTSSDAKRDTSPSLPLPFPSIHTAGDYLV
jgi:hypothetical protein